MQFDTDLLTTEAKSLDRVSNFCYAGATRQFDTDLFTTESKTVDILSLL